MFVFGDAAFVGQVQIGQRQSVDGHTARLAIGSITGLLRDATLLNVHPQSADLGRFFCSQVVSGNVECAPVGVKPVAGDEFPQRHDVCPIEIKGPWAGSAGKPTLGRRRDAALVDAVARQESLDPENRERVRGLVTAQDRVDVLVAPPQELFFFPFQRTSVFLAMQIGTGGSGPGEPSMQPFEDDLQFSGGLADCLFNGGKTSQFRCFRWPVLGKEGQKPSRQRILDLGKQSLQRLRAGRTFPGSCRLRPTDRCE